MSEEEVARYREVVGLIVRANSAEDKRPDLLALRERLDALLVSMRIAKEVQAFKSFGAYQQAVEAVVSVCRQNEGWLRSLGAQGKAKARGPESARP